MIVDYMTERERNYLFYNLIYWRYKEEESCEKISLKTVFIVYLAL